MTQDHHDKERKARERVRKLKAFYTNVTSYVLINILLIIINLVTSPKTLWFYWVTLIWGAVLIVQAFSVFTIKDRYLGDSWEEKKMRELLDKEEKEEEKRRANKKDGE